MQILREHGVEIEVVEYLKTPPSKDELGYLYSKLGIEPKELIRTKEKRFAELGLLLEYEPSQEE